MKNRTRAIIARSAVFLIAVLATGLASQPADATDLVLHGSYHTTVEQKGRVAANDYNDANAAVTVHYNIPVITNPQTMMKEFDLANATLTFEYLFNGAPFKTVNVPITDVRGNPETGEIISFEFKGTQWDPQRPAQNNGISGVVDVEGKTASIKSGYTSGGQMPTITSYTFETQNEKPAPPKQDPKSKEPLATGSSVAPSQSIDFNATTGILSISGDTIVATPNPSDPILGATVNFSDYQFMGFTSDGALAIFWPTSNNGLLTIASGMNTFEQGDLPVLFYDVTDNLFYGSPLDFTLAGMPTSSPFYNPNLATISSPYLNGLEDVLDPASPDFDPNAHLFVTISPDTNLDTATNGFTASGDSAGTDSQFVADTPEPSTLAILIAGLAGLRLFRRGQIHSRRAARL